MNADLAPDLPANPTLKFPEEPMESPTAGLDGISSLVEGLPKVPVDMVTGGPERFRVDLRERLDLHEILSSRERLETKLIDALVLGGRGAK